MSAVTTSTLLVQRTARNPRHIRSSNSHLFLSHSGNGYRIDVFSVAASTLCNSLPIMLSWLVFY